MIIRRTNRLYRRSLSVKIQSGELAAPLHVVGAKGAWEIVANVRGRMFLLHTAQPTKSGAIDFAKKRYGVKPTVPKTATIAALACSGTIPAETTAI